jgi:hypothetical protein
MPARSRPQQSKPSLGATRLALTGLAAAVALTGLCAADAPPTLTYDPNHYQNNDPLWEILNQTLVTADTAKGEYTAKFPRVLMAREDKPIRITGFILPLEPKSYSAHFMLVRRNTGCPFCPPNAPTEAVEIFATKPFQYMGEEIAVTGRLKLVSASSEGLFYQINGAEVAANSR